MNSTKLMQREYRKLDLENRISVPFLMKQEVRQLQVRGNTLITHNMVFFHNLLHTLNYLLVFTMFSGARGATAG
jgi:hypothetical protein